MPVRIKKTPQPGAADGHCATPWFGRTERAGLDTPPTLLTFDTTDFLDRFIDSLDAAIDGEQHPFPELVPLRDWSEPPRVTYDAVGATLLPGTVVRDPIDDGEARWEDGTRPEDVVTAEEALSGPRWLRKLYLPVHRHFHLVASEFVCDRGSTADGDRSAIAADRIAEAGAVIRRLIPAPGPERWEDWVSLGQGLGAWVELAVTTEATPASPRGNAVLGEAGTPLDPTAPRAHETLDAAARTRLGLADPAAPLPPLVPVRMSPLPPDQRNGRSTWFAYLPVSSAEREASDDAFAVVAPADMSAQAAAGLDATLGAQTAGVQQQVRDAWSDLIDVLSGPDTSHARFGPAPADSAADALQDLQDLVDNAQKPITDPNVVLQLSTGRLAQAMREAAVILVTAFPFGDQLATPLWTGGDSSVAGLWALDVAGWAQGTVRTSGGPALRAQLTESLDVALASGWSQSPSDDHRIVAAVLLWVRAHRVLLHRTLRFSLPPVVDPETPEERTTLDPHNPNPTARVPLFTVGSASGELEALIVAEESRATTPRPWDPVNLSSGAAAVHVAVHRAALALEDALAELNRVGSAGGSGWAVAGSARAQALRSDSGLSRSLGLDLDAQPERGLLALDALHLDTQWNALRADVLDHFDPGGDTDAIAVLEAEAGARQAMVRPRFDSDHVYALWTYTRIEDPRPCHEPRLAWSGRTEPFSIADHHDLLGTKPVALRLPDLPAMLRDLPRMTRAGAMPMAAVSTPADSGFVVGEDPKDTVREWGIAWICSFGIPIFTICAWIVFSIILNILLMLPGFAWMLLLKICIPVPAPKGGS